MFEIRMNLSDVLGNEDDIFEYLNIVFDKQSYDKVKFWYNGSISQADLDSFVDKGRKKLNSEIRLQMAKRTPQNEFAWFDIIADSESKAAMNRFTFTYTNKKDIVKGIISFYNMMEHIISNGQKKKLYNKDNE